MTIAYVGLGGNLGDVPARIAAAVERIRAWPEVDDVVCSPLYRSEPVGPIADQPAFVNAVARIDLGIGPRALLDRLLDLERRLGRDRSAAVPQGPRAIDLDVLLYGDRIIVEPGLRVPHPRLSERAFALAPLRDVAGGQLHIPGTSATIDALLAQPRVRAQGVTLYPSNHPQSHRFSSKT